MVNILKLREIQKNQKSGKSDNNHNQTITEQANLNKNTNPPSFGSEAAKQALLKSILDEIESDPLLGGTKETEIPIENDESDIEPTEAEITEPVELKPVNIAETGDQPTRPAPEDSATIETTFNGPEKTQKETCDLVTFFVDNRLFGIEIDFIQSVVRPTEITRVPNIIDYILGVINLRGNIRPVIDLRKRFNLGTTTITEKTRIVILQLNDHQFGFMVDNVANIIHVPIADIESPPPITQGIDTSYVKSVVKLSNENTMLILLDLRFVFNPDTMH